MFEVHVAIDGTYIARIIQRVVATVDKLVHQFSEFIKDIHDHSCKHLAFAASKCHLLQFHILQRSLKVVLNSKLNRDEVTSLIAS